MYRTAVKKDPRYGAAHYHNALAQLRLNRFGPAEGSLRRAIELLPEGPDRVASRVQLADIYIAYMESVKRDRLVIREVDRLCDEARREETARFIEDLKKAAAVLHSS